MALPAAAEPEEAGAAGFCEKEPGAAAGKKDTAESAKENARLLEMGHNVTSPVHQGLSMHTLSAYKKTREFTASCPQVSHFK